MKWLAGSEENNTGLLELDDGTIIAKEYTISSKGGVQRTWRLIATGQLLKAPKYYE